MASWYRKYGKYVTIVYTDAAGKERHLSRRLYKHLDNRPDADIDMWMEQWERLNSAQAHRPDTIGTTPEQERAIAAYMSHLQHDKERAPNTLANYRRWLKWAISYFGGEPFQHWPKRSRDYGRWLMDERSVSPEETLSANRALKNFWAWLDDEELLGEDVPQLKVRGGKKKWKATPLQSLIYPEDVLGWAERLEQPMALIVLLQYFFSLRPQETFALHKKHFTAGDEAAGMECGKQMKGYGLYDRLSVYIHRQKTEDGSITPPKDWSVGNVACFDKHAARAIVGMLSAYPDEGELFPKKPNRYYNMWRDARAPLGVTASLKDLRRASLYWLGHYKPFTAITLQKHSRHESIESLEYYLRRPGERMPGEHITLALGDEDDD